MKVYFNAKDVQLKVEEEHRTEPTTKLTKKQVEAVKLYAKAYMKNYINHIKNK